MKLFDDVPRIRRGPAAHYEDSFSFLTGSSQPYAANVRDLLESWFGRYPEANRAEMRRTFQHEFDVAFFELLLHELLLQLACEVAVHPVIASSSSRPDFGVGGSAGRFYVEARVASDKSASETARDRALAVFFDQVDKLTLDDYFLHLSAVEFPAGQPPSARRFRQYVKQCTENVSYSSVLALASLNHHDSLPSFEYREGGAIVEFTLIPVRPDRRLREGKRAIGIFPGKHRWGSSATSIRRALTRKSGKYGRLPSPFVIAVNSTSEWGTRRDDIIEALFGSEDIAVDFMRRQRAPGPERDGFWIGTGGTQHRRVAAALVGSVNPYNLGVADLVLWLNPWATSPYSGPLLTMTHATVTEEKIRVQEGMSLRDLLHIPSDWPGDRDED